MLTLRDWSSLDKAASFKLQATSLTAGLGWYRMNLERINYEKKIKSRISTRWQQAPVILDKAVQYLKDPRFGLQGDKMHFLMEELGLSESEYLTCLNRGNSGGEKLVSRRPGAPMARVYLGHWRWLRNRDQATSGKPQAASVKQQA